MIVVGGSIEYLAWLGSQRAVPGSDGRPSRRSVRCESAATGLGLAGGVLCLGGLAVIVSGLDNPFGVVALRDRPGRRRRGHRHRRGRREAGPPHVLIPRPAPEPSFCPAERSPGQPFCRTERGLGPASLLDRHALVHVAGEAGALDVEVVETFDREARSRHQLVDAAVQVAATEQATLDRGEAVLGPRHRRDRATGRAR